MQEIICVLDVSASMQSVAPEAVGGFNQFLDEQQKVGEANITVVFFDNVWTLHYQGRLSKCQPLEYWRHGGMTALHDAIGKTINHVKERFANEKPEKVIMAILTDGDENCSHQFSRHQIANLLKEHQDKYGWDVIYLASNQDAWEKAQALNIPQANTFNYQDCDVRETFRGVMGQSVTKSRVS